MGTCLPCRPRADCKRPDSIYNASNHDGTHRQTRRLVEAYGAIAKSPASRGRQAASFCASKIFLPITANGARPRCHPGTRRAPVTYGALWVRVNDAVRELRSLGVGRSDRVAVVLPDGPETAVAMIAVAAGAVCVPLNPGFTADEWQRYFGDLRVAALLTRADMDSASRGVAHALGIPVIDLSPRPGEGPARSALSARQRAAPSAASWRPARDNDAFILLTSGTTSRPKMVPLTHASVCLSAHNVGAALALGPRDRLLNVLPLFHAHGLISGLLAALAAGSSVVCTPGFDAAAFFGWLTEFRPTWYTAVPAIHRALLSAADRHKHERPAVLVAAHPFGLFVSAARRAQRAGSAVRRPGDRDLRHDGSRLPDCRKPSGATQAWFGRPVRRAPRSRSWTARADGCQPANVERSRCGARPSQGIRQ